MPKSMKRPDKVWVYSGTAIPFTKSFNLTDLINITTDIKSGSIQGDLQKADGTSDRIEFITKNAQKKRKGIWVYAGTNIPFPENVNAADLTNTTTNKKNGLITHGTLKKSDGTIFQIEFITKVAQAKREGVWVYAGTNVPFPEKVDLSNLMNTTTNKKSGWITQGTLQISDGTTHRVEFIAKQVQKLREGVWVYANTGIPFPENVNLADLTNTTTDKKSGWITQGTLQKPDGTSHNVEFIKKAALKLREGTWVYAGTNILFPENINLSDLTNTKTNPKSGWITQGTLQTSDGTTHHVEFITKGALEKREGMWVYAGTSIPFPENINLANLTNTTTDKNDLITRGTLQTPDGSTHHVEFITKQIQKLRTGIWVYQGTGIPFPEKVNISDLTNTTTDKKSGFITEGTLRASDGSIHHVEFITKGAQVKRERVWVYVNTGILFPEKINLSDLTNTITDKKNGFITQGTLRTSDGSIHHVEFITKSAQIKRSRKQQLLDQASENVSMNKTWTPSLFHPSNQSEKNDQNKPHKRVKR